LDQPPTPNRPDPVTSPPGTGTAPNDPVRAALNGQPPPAPEAPPPPPLTPVGWLMQNGPFLLVLLVGLGWLAQRYGLDVIWQGVKVALGLGLVIFIHELGHFLAAKWCDVHVTTFSIGFGPALPGCSFQRGETTYKIAMLPLGGYVNMVGEGPEAEEDENYPRSFKNKGVGQRMLIISAGVIMNVLLGCVCFVLVYRLHGVDRAPAVVWMTDAGSPAWQAGVRTDGWTIVRIDNLSNPWFDDLKVKVALSSARPLPFVFRKPDGTEVTLDIEPRRGDNETMPVIGVVPAPKLEVWPASAKKHREVPFAYQSAAASAREIDLRPGDVVLKATDPDKGGELSDLKHDLKTRTFDAAELCRRMTKLGAAPLTLEVNRADAGPDAPPETLSVPARGFDWGDTILGTTDSANPADLFRVKALPPYPGNPGEDARDPFEFRRRLKELAGRPVVVQVRRHGAAPSAPPANVLVPPAYHYTLGLRMKMGKVAAVRNNSPAARAGVMPGDVISKVSLSHDGGPEAALPEKDLDPVRLPFALASRVAGRPDRSKWRVRLTVLRKSEGQHKDVPTDLEPMAWEDDWRYDVEAPYNRAAPQAVPQLGLAYYVESTVFAVEPDSPAARAGIQPNDRVEQIALREPGRTAAEASWGHWFPLEAQRGKEKTYDAWAFAFDAMQRDDFHEVKLQVRRGDALLPEMTVGLTADGSWPSAETGLKLVQDTRLQIASTTWEALSFGVERTGGFIKQIYLNISSLISGRISPKTLGGPLEIASQAFLAAGEDIYVFLLFLGIISVNLAVVNFLPIPVLDGGHMVFLIYEKVSGRRPSEAVRAAATYLGLAILAALMIWVFYLDIMRRMGGNG
jgi:regulator of sigma E protease